MRTIMRKNLAVMPKNYEPGNVKTCGQVVNRRGMGISEIAGVRVSMASEKYLRVTLGRDVQEEAGLHDGDRVEPHFSLMDNMYPCLELRPTGSVDGYVLRHHNHSGRDQHSHALFFCITVGRIKGDLPALWRYLKEVCPAESPVSEFSYKVMDDAVACWLAQ